MHLCKDCNGITMEGVTNHEATCPILIGYNEAGADDMRYFEENPDEFIRHRQPTLPELLMVLSVTGQEHPDVPEGHHVVAGGTVTVHRGTCDDCGDISVIRSYDDCMLMLACTDA